MERKLSSPLLMTFLLVFAAIIINCGSDNHQIVQSTPQTTTFAFLQEVSGQPYIFTPVLGSFTVSGGNAQFTATPVKDPDTGNPVSGEFWSIVLSHNGKKAVIDLYGGLDGSSYTWDIWIGNSDGSETPFQVTSNGYDNWMPQLSPDGTKIVYLSGSKNYWASWIDTVNVDGTGEQMLPIPAGVMDEFSPTYSPDGTRIAFYAAGYDENGGELTGIWVMNVDGSNPQMLTNPYGNGDCSSYCWDDFPAYTADGSKIVFSREYYGEPGSNPTSDILIMNAADGSSVTKLTDGVGINFDPQMLTINGLGDRVLFSSNRDHLGSNTGGVYELNSMRTDGGGVTRLTNNALYDGFCGQWYVPTQQRAYRPLPHRPTSGLRR
jgi:Tol biopolymer transport system component